MKICPSSNCSENHIKIFLESLPEIYFILKWVGPQRYLYFFRIYLFCSYRCMFPACCFLQRTYIAQGLVNGVLNEPWTLSFCSLNGFQWVIGFIWRSLFFFFECVYFSLLYSSFAVDIWYILFLFSCCVCVCWRGFGFHLVIFSLYERESVLRFVCVCVCVCVCIYIYIYI